MKINSFTSHNIQQSRTTFFIIQMRKLKHRQIFKKVVNQKIRKLNSSLWFKDSTSQGIFCSFLCVYIYDFFTTLSFVRTGIIPILVSWGYCNNLTQTLWLKTTENYSLSVLESRSTELRYQHGLAPSKGSREKSLTKIENSLPSPASGEYRIYWYWFMAA